MAIVTLAYSDTSVVSLEWKQFSSHDPTRHLTNILPGCDLVEDSPDVLPGLVAGAVEEGVLQPVRPRRRPALADVGQVRA